MKRKLLCLVAAGNCFMALAQVPAARPAAATLEFVENRGQWPAPVRYAAEVPGGRLFLEPSGLTYALLAGVPHGHDAARQSPAAASAEIKAHALRVVFAGGATQPALSSESQTPEVRNYLRGNDPAAWAAHVPSFRQVRYAGIWPGIGAHFYENPGQQLEYDFELAADADPAAIALRYEGADGLTLSAAGSLEIQTSLGVLRELAPQAWQTDAAGHRQPVACAYALEGRTVRFRLGQYDRHRPLTIDPTVVFSSYTNSTADNWGFTATYDAQGNLYSGGIVFGPGYPTTTGAYSTTFSSIIDIGIIKYNTATTGPASRVWATYIGGSQADFPHSMVVSRQGELVLLGTTGSSNYPTSAAAYDRSFNGGTSITPTGTATMPGSDLVVTRLSADGARLVGSTYLGGSANDGLLSPTQTPLVQNYGDAFRGDILLDAADNIYLASSTASPDFPVSSGLGGNYRGGTNDAVVCKLSPTASALQWSSFLGGAGTDAAYSIQLSAAGSVYVSGGTTSANFPTTPGALHPSALGGVDGFVARISNTGTVLQKATYLGTSAYDQSYFLQLDGSGAVYALGQSLGSYPVTAGRYQNAGSKQFIHKLDADLATTSFSTVFGSGRSTIDISPTAFLVDECNRIYVSGWGGRLNSSSSGGTTGLPVTPNAVQRTTDGEDFYLFQLAPDATRLDYATFFGQAGGSGDHVDGGTSRFDPRGVVYQAVCACGRTSGFPVPPGAGSYSATSGSGNCNNAAFKLNFETVNVAAGTDRNVCVAAAPQPLIGSPAGGVWSGPGVSGSVAAGFVFTPTPALLGTHTLTYTVTGVGPCGGVSTVRLTVVPAPTAAFTPAATSFCLNATTSAPVPLSATPAGGTFSGPGVVAGFFYPSNAGAGTHTLVYNVNANGCLLQATQAVTVVRAVAPPSFAVCSNGAATPLIGTPAGGVWSGPGVSGSVSAGFVFTPSSALLGTRVLTYTIAGASGCTSAATLAIEVQPASPFVPTPLPGYCATTTTPVALPGSAMWFGPGVRGPASNGFTFTPSLAGPGTFLLTYRSGFGACEITGTMPVTVSSPAVISLPPDTVLCPGTTQPFQLRASPAGGTWSGPNVSSTGRFTPPANFSGSVALTYTATVGACVSTATRRVSVAPPPTYEARWVPELCADTRQAPLAVRFSDPLTASADVSWDFGDGTQGRGNAIGHVYAQPGRYQPRVIRTYNNGRCSITLDLPVLEVERANEVPNIITPNGDVKNEYFKATNGCPARLQVFSRWGSKVFEAASYRNDWNGGSLPAGVYYYHLQYLNGPALKGWLEIAR
jgi:gliding motility-associated-like protein